MNRDNVHFDGIEIGTISLKWCRIYEDLHQKCKIIRHEGNPKLKLIQLFDDHKIAENCFITDQSSTNFIDTQYKPGTDVLKKY